VGYAACVTSKIQHCAKECFCSEGCAPHLCPRSVEKVFDILGGGLDAPLPRLRGSPKRAWIDPIRIQRQHLPVKLRSRRCTCHRGVEIADADSRSYQVPLLNGGVNEKSEPGRIREAFSNILNPS
jgi:hypothetical protein